MSDSPSTPPQLSPDGKFYWDGAAWQPMPAHHAAPIQQVRVSGSVVTRPARWRYVFWTVLILGLLFAGICTAARH